MPAMQSNPKTLSALNAEVVLDVRDSHYASIAVTGTFSGTITFSISANNVDYFPYNMKPSNNATTTSTTTTPGGFDANVQPWGYIKAAMTAYTNGSAVVTLNTLQLP